MFEGNRGDLPAFQIFCLIRKSTKESEVLLTNVVRYVKKYEDR